MLKPLVVCLFVAVAACTHAEKARVVSAPVPEGEGKPMAPVSVAGELGTARAHLTLKFEAPCEKAVATINGLDGLAVQQIGAGVGERDFKAGETATLDAELSGTGTLVVRITGTFNGATKDRVVTFAVGEVKLDRSGERVTPDNGPGMKVKPSGN